ncbi:MAG: hypothetical protein HDS67_04395 [Bacteroidales bacterium]|nr:hypothetical protein [Bacteroidales bacterium]MBD5283195.1 hypothetical protein [Bacteroides sp.]
MMILGGGVWFLMNDSLVNPWLFWGVIGFVSIATGVILGRRWEKVTHVSNFAVNLAVHVVVLGLFLAFGLLVLNYSTAHLADAPQTDVTVEKKFTKTRYHSQRSGRRTYRRGDPYQVYFIGLDIPDFGERSFEIPRSIYSSVRTGDTATIKMARGCLGFPVVDRMSVKPLRPRIHRKSRREYHSPYDSIRSRVLQAAKARRQSYGRSHASAPDHP